MKTRKIESLDASVAVLGCNNFGWHTDADATQSVVGAALDAGINFSTRSRGHTILELAFS